MDESSGGWSSTWHASVVVPPVTASAAQTEIYKHLLILCQHDPPSPLFFTPAGTNDKAGSPFYLLRWMSPLSIKESLAPLEDWSYPSVDPST